MDLTEEDGRFLLCLARKTIEQFIKGEGEPIIPEHPKRLDEKRGVFCTIKKDGQLRGCIGMPYAVTSLVKAVVASSYSSAFEDPRFPPLRKDELDRIKIEISVLTEPELIEAKSKDKREEEIKKGFIIGEHGLIIKKDHSSGLLLPQVPVEQNWDEDQFLEALCIKAGLDRNAWKESDAEIYRFKAQIFSER